jgi:hypothetical protein
MIGLMISLLRRGRSSRDKRTSRLIAMPKRDSSNTMKEVIKQGVEIDRKQNLFDDEHNRIIADNDAL